jgi:hypothetical protein
VWSAVVTGLEAARYAEVGSEYAKLSALLVEQRTAQVLAGEPLGPEWIELSRAARRTLDVLEPLLSAARLLASMPVEGPAPRPVASTRSRTATRTPPAPRAAKKKS